MTPTQTAEERNKQYWDGVMRLPELDRIKAAMKYLVGRISSAPVQILSVDETLLICDAIQGPPSPKSVEAAGIFARMEQNSRAVAAMPDYVKGSPVNSRQTAPAPETAPAPRRMTASSPTSTCEPGCFHLKEHAEVTGDDGYYQNLCAYHGCQPVTPPEATKAGRRVFITDENSVIVSEVQPITRERLRELYAIFDAAFTARGKNGEPMEQVDIECDIAGIRAVLESLGLPMADEK